MSTFLAILASIGLSVVWFFVCAAVYQWSIRWQCRRGNHDFEGLGLGPCMDCGAPPPEGA